MCVCVFFWVGSGRVGVRITVVGLGGEEGGERNGGDECVIIGACMID